MDLFYRECGALDQPAHRCGHHSALVYHKFVKKANPMLLTILRKKAFENIVGNEKILVTSIFSYSHNVFYPAKDKL